jgi:hypothetical protein
VMASIEESHNISLELECVVASEVYEDVNMRVQRQCGRRRTER